jgi:hypothetical protein
MRRVGAVHMRHSLRVDSGMNFTARGGDRRRDAR